MPRTLWAELEPLLTISLTLKQGNTKNLLLPHNILMLAHLILFVDCATSNQSLSCDLFRLLTVGSGKEGPATDSTDQTDTETYDGRRECRGEV